MPGLQPQLRNARQYSSHRPPFGHRRKPHNIHPLEALSRVVLFRSAAVRPSGVIRTWNLVPWGAPCLPWVSQRSGTGHVANLAHMPASCLSFERYGLLCLPNGTRALPVVTTPPGDPHWDPPVRRSKTWALGMAHCFLLEGGPWLMTQSQRAGTADLGPQGSAATGRRPQQSWIGGRSCMGGRRVWWAGEKAAG